MILAAGLGTRMRPLTDDAPKPMLQVGGKPLIEHHLERLAAAGVQGVVVNLFHLGGQIQEALGSGRHGMRIRYSREAILLGSGGGIIKALPLLQGDRFIAVNADVWTDFDYNRLSRQAADGVDGHRRLGHLVLVGEAGHNPQGDFYLDGDGLVHHQQPGGGSSARGELRNDARRLTFSGISLLHKNLFRNMQIQPRPLAPILQAAMPDGRISGELYSGRWMDIGTPKRLEEANATANAR